MSKISELSDGGSLVSSDYLIAVRSGGNVKVRMDQINVDQVDLGDNEFIRLGNSQDLTMVHTSTQSIINQAGIGDLLLQKAGATKLTINATGIDVTGSVTADGLTVDGQADFESGASLGSGLNVNRSGHPSYGIVTGGNTEVYHAVKPNGGSWQTYMKVTDGGDISFYEDTGTTPKFFWDASAESLGIGTASPSTSLDVVRAGVQPLRLQSTSGTEVAINMVNTGGNVQLEAHSGNFTIDADNVGIGTSSPSSARLQIKGTGTTVSTNAIFAENSVGAGLFAIRDNGEAFILGNAGIGTSSPNTKVELSGARNTSELRLSSTSNDASWTAGDYIGKLSFYSGDQSGAGVGIKGSIATVATSPSGGSTDMVFSVATTSSNEQEAMRLDADGLVFAAVQYTGGFGAQTTSGTESFDDSSNARAGNGHTLLQGSDTGGPGGLAYYHVFNYEYSTKDGTGNMTQLAYGYNTAQAYIRYRFGGTWSSWAALT